MLNNEKQPQKKRRSLLKKKTSTVDNQGLKSGRRLRNNRNRSSKTPKETKSSENPLLSQAPSNSIIHRMLKNSSNSSPEQTPKNLTNFNDDEEMSRYHSRRFL